MTKTATQVTRRPHNEQESLQSDTRTHALWHEPHDDDDDDDGLLDVDGCHDDDDHHPRHGF